MGRFLLSGVLILALLLRVMAIAQYPVGFTPDEASFGYDAYSLLKTGKDQWGEAWPLALRSFGDFKLPLYSYLTIPSVAIFGLNEFAVRLPGAIFGTLAVLVTFFLVGELLRRSKFQISTSNFQFLASLLLAISPWHVSLSRGAFEANLTTFFLPLGVFAFLKGLVSFWWMMVAAVVFGLNLFTYHSARFVTPIVILGLIVLARREFNILRYKLPIGIFILFLLVAGFSTFFGAGRRGVDIAIFNPTDRWATVSDRRYEAVRVGMPDSMARFFSNKAVYLWDNFIANYLSYLSPQFLFTQGAGEWTYGMIPGRGVLYLVELPAILAGLIAFARKPNRNFSFILFWILVAPIAAALTKGVGHAANRAAVMMPAVQILSAYGALSLLWSIHEKWKIATQKKLLYGYIAMLLVSLVFFMEDYVYHAIYNQARGMLYGRRQAQEFLQEIEANYKEIIVSRQLSEPHIYVAFYKKLDPGHYQKASLDWLRYEKEGKSFVDQLGEYRLGKYVFRQINFEKDSRHGSLLVGQLQDFPTQVRKLKVINYPDGKPAILIVDPSFGKYATAH